MIRSPLLSRFPEIRHAFTGRGGGTSRPPYDTLNLAFHVGDDPAAVEQNHDRLAEALGYDRSRLVHMRQIHSGIVTLCDAASGFDRPPECDAIMTDIPGQALMVMTADCTPVLFYDPVRRAVAAVHAGRAGAFKNIVGAAVGAMSATFGSRPETIVAALGPSIRSCCYEVGKAVAEEAGQKGFAFALSSRNGKIFLDVNAVLLRQLETAGIAPENTDLLPHCTACERDRFFSYRADGGVTGRQAGVIVLPA